MRNAALRKALSIAGIYALCGSLWIALSDRLLAAFVRDSETLTRFQTYKGGVFVFATAVLVFFLTRRAVRDITGLAEKLKQSEEGLRAQYKNLPVPTFTWRKIGRQFRLDDYNAAALEMTGGKVADFLDADLETLYADSPEIIHDVFRAFDERTVIGKELFYTVRSTGERKHFAVKYAFVSPDRVLVHAEDISARKQAEEALQKSERMLQTIIDAEPECVKVLDENACLIMMNRAGLDMIQVDKLDAVKGQCVCPLVTSEYRPQFMDLTKRVFQGETGTLLFEMVGMKGRRLWLETHAVPLRNEKNEIVALLGVTRDVTEQRRAEKALRASEERFRDLAESLPLTVFEIDPQGRFTYVNHAALETFGYGQRDIEAGVFLEQVIASADRDRARTALGRRMTGAPRGNVEYLGLRKDGTTFPISVASIPILQDGHPVGLRGIVSDLTQRKELEEERLKTEKLESIATLAGGIAHDFNNLLQGVFGYISMAKRVADDRQRSLEMLNQSEKALHLAVNLTTQLLTFSKGGAPIKKRIELRPMIENAVKFALSGSCVTYRLMFDEGLSAVNADEGQLSQVIQNIVLNADQAMPMGGVIDVEARNVAGRDQGLPASLSSGEFVAITVRDSGIGMPEHLLSRIFDPYFTTKEKGSGLGLATSYSIVKNHGGMIDVKSEAGKGSRFTIYLPAAGSEAPVEVLPRTIAIAGRPVRILVMDDEEIVRMVAAELLRSLGHQVETAEHGMAALELFQAARHAGAPYEVVILDLTVRGGMGGLETLRKMREIDPGVKAVVSSGYSDDAALSSHRQYGFQSFLRKPYDQDELERVLNALLV